MRISDWSSDVCSSDLGQLRGGREAAPARSPTRQPNARILWAAGWGRGPVSPRKSLFRDFPTERPTRHHARDSRGFCLPAPLAAAGVRFCCPVRSKRAFVVLTYTVRSWVGPGSRTRGSGKALDVWV